MTRSASDTPRKSVRTSAIFIAFVVALLCAVLIGHLVMRDRPRTDAGGMRVGVTPTPTVSTSTPVNATLVPSAGPDAVADAREPVATAQAVSAAQALTAAMPSTDGNLSVAVLDPATGEVMTAGAKRSYVTASIVKVDILATLLLQAQEEGRSLTSNERATATIMIKESDNKAADRLWRVIGGASGLRAANTEFGLKETVPSGYAWGLTKTTAADQLRLLTALTSDTSALNAASRAYIVGLMSAVQTDQSWGVSVAADTGTVTTLKNGWLPRNTNGLWVINSIGRVTHRGHAVLVAVLSDSQQSMDTGVDQVENVVAAVLPAIAATLG